MKHKITFSVIAAAALASCTQNEDFTSQYNEKAKTMKFDVAYVGKNTRATGDITSIDNKKFILWGAAYKTSTSTSEGGTTTETVASTGIWITDQEPLYFKKGTSYWEGYKEEACSNKADVAYPGNNYKTYFTAIAPSDEFEKEPEEGTSATKATYSMNGQKSEAATSPSSSARKLTLDNIPVVQEINNTSGSLKGTDYLIACHNGITEEVALQFKHLLSKLRFAVWTDENTMNGDNPTTKIELNYLKVYLPKASATAKYVQKAHDAVAGYWTWSGFSAPDENGQPSIDETSGNYQLVELYDKGQNTDGKTVSYFADANTAHTSTYWESVKLDKDFFIAPTESTTSSSSATTVKLYIDIEYTVRRKVGSDWSTTNEESKKGEAGQVYSAGHKVVKRTKMLVPINDGTHPDDSNNEGLSHFHQGFIETLYICLRADQKVTFSTNFDVDDWVKDPIDGKQL